MTCTSVSIHSKQVLAFVSAIYLAYHINTSINIIETNVDAILNKYFSNKLKYLSTVLLKVLWNAFQYQSYSARICISV